MTNELEKQFFDTFGIKKRGYCGRIYQDRCFENCPLYPVRNTDECLKYIEVYPQITDRILLELMFLITDINTSFELRNIRNVTALKTAILEFFIKKYGSSQNRKILKHQVRTLFEEG